MSAVNNVRLIEVIEALEKHGERAIARKLRHGFLSLPWTSESGDFEVEQSILDLHQSGTPVVTDEDSKDFDEDCYLDLPIPK